MLLIYNLIIENNFVTKLDTLMCFYNNDYSLCIWVTKIKHKNTLNVLIFYNKALQYISKSISIVQKLLIDEINANIRLKFSKFIILLLYNVVNLFESCITEVNSILYQ